jgi:hypothetical protein
MTVTVPNLQQYLEAPLSIGDPDIAGPLTAFPLFGPAPKLEYLAFAQGVARGVTVHELQGGGSVNDLTIHNPTGTAVLLYDGEEVLGAQQNRTFDVSILVGAGAKLDVPVSCVEYGRWDGARHADAFAPAPQTAYPALRRAKSRQVRHAVAAGMEARAEQGHVWDEVAHKHARMNTASPTGAMHDIYEQRRDQLADMCDKTSLHDGQIGTLVAIAGEFTVIDLVSRADVYEVLHGPLVQGYALDALEHRAEAAPPSMASAEEFLELIWEQRVSEQDGIGLGRDVRFEGHGVAGAALVSGSELVQLTAFADDDSPNGDSLPSTHRARIRRPSRRRAA